MLNRVDYARAFLKHALVHGGVECSTFTGTIFNKEEQQPFLSLEWQ